MILFLYSFLLLFCCQMFDLYIYHHRLLSIAVYCWTWSPLKRATTPDLWQSIFDKYGQSHCHFKVLLGYIGDFGSLIYFLVFDFILRECSGIALFRAVTKKPNCLVVNKVRRELRRNLLVFLGVVRSLWAVCDRVIAGEKMLRDAHERWSNSTCKNTKMQSDNTNNGIDFITLCISS